VSDHDLYIQECDESGEPHHWLALERTPVQIRRLGLVVWEGEACELAGQIKRLQEERDKFRDACRFAKKACVCRNESNLFTWMSQRNWDQFVSRCEAAEEVKLPDWEVPDEVEDGDPFDESYELPDDGDRADEEDLDVLPCSRCGEPVRTVPEGLALCNACAQLTEQEIWGDGDEAHEREDDGTLGRPDPA